MRKIDFDEKMVLEYYLQQFAQDLPNYFETEDYNGKNLILDVDRRRNNGRKRTLNRLGNPSGSSSFFGGNGSTEKNFVFAGLFSYMILTQQAIKEACGIDIQESFHRCTGRPWISAGMAGPDYSFRKMLEEAVLYPNDAEKENFANMLEVVKRVMNKEMSDFLTAKNSDNLNAREYKKILDATSGKTDEIIQHITTEIDSLIGDLKNEFEINGNIGFCNINCLYCALSPDITDQDIDFDHDDINNDYDVFIPCKNCLINQDMKGLVDEWNQLKDFDDAKIAELEISDASWHNKPCSNCIENSINRINNIIILKGKDYFRKYSPTGENDKNVVAIAVDVNINSRGEWADFIFQQCDKSKLNTKDFAIIDQDAECAYYMKINVEKSIALGLLVFEKI